MAQGLKLQKLQTSTPLQLGWISYWNLYPLKCELERLAGGEIDFHKGTPAVVNRWLAERGCFASVIRPLNQSLEGVFFELTGEQSNA